MAMVTKAERFGDLNAAKSPKRETAGEVSSLSLGSANRSTDGDPGPYVGHSTYQVRPSYAPFGSTKVRIQNKDAEAGPPPGAYDPKPIKAYDSGLPKKHVPFATGAQRSSMAKEDKGPGPGDYGSAAMGAEKRQWSTMGAPSGSHKVIFRSSSAPSIPRGGQCFGYEETGDGKLVRQGPKGKVYMSGRLEDSAGPGQYDARFEVVAPKPAGGRFLGGVRPGMAGKAGEMPGPGHYVAEMPTQAVAVSSSFVSTSAPRGLSQKAEKKIADTPGPGHYPQSKPARPSLREQHPELQYFGSTSERFKEQPASRQPGPGAYTDGLAQRRTWRGANAKGSWATDSRFNEDSKVSVQPGPGQYDPSAGMAAAQMNTASILGSTGNLAFGSHESKRGVDLKESWAPGPGAYGTPAAIFDEGESTVASKKGAALRRRPKPPHASFKSETAKDVLGAQTVKEGLMGPPPGAYSPMHIQDTAAVMRLPPKSEGFGSAAPRLAEASKEVKAPGPGWYAPPISITGGKKSGTFNRSVFEGAPEHGKPKGLGFESQARRFKDSAQAKQPGPGAYHSELGLITKTFNIHFGDIV